MAPANVTVKLVEKPSDELCEEAVKIFCALTTADSAALAFVGGNLDLMDVMVRAVMRSIALVGDVYCAFDDTGALIGYTSWLPPGRDLFLTEEQRQLGYYTFMDSVSEEGKAYFSKAMSEEYPKFIDETVGISEAKLNTYWCWIAMVRTDYQGKGVAKALYHLAYEKAKQHGWVMALSTTNVKNVEIYKKIGFELKGHTIMASPWMNWPAWIFSWHTNAS